MPSRAVAFYRKSQGDEDDVSLQLQREHVHDLASDHAGEVEEVDLGVHTGFSIHMRPDSEERIDTNDKVLALLEDLRTGEYSYLAAWDDTRLARDQFFWELKRAAIIGGCELVFVEEPPDDSLTFRVQRAVESDVKRREIEKSKAAMEERQEQGHDQGRPPYGLRYDNVGERWVPDREAENVEKSDFQQALDVIDLRRDGVSWRDIADRTGVHKDTARSIWQRRERYLQEAEAGA
jgi:DNA invertase Pin-like site-specific DNA recombinase